MQTSSSALVSRRNQYIKRNVWAVYWSEHERFKSKCSKQLQSFRDTFKPQIMVCMSQNILFQLHSLVGMKPSSLLDLNPTRSFCIGIRRLFIDDICWSKQVHGTSWMAKLLDVIPSRTTIYLLSPLLEASLKHTTRKSSLHPIDAHNLLDILPQLGRWHSLAVASVVV